MPQNVYNLPCAAFLVARIAEIAMIATIASGR